MSVDFLKGFGALAELATSVTSKFDVVGQVVEKFCEGAGLDPKTSAIVKMGVGFATGQILTAADGALDLVQAAANDRPATTEYHCATPAKKDNEASTGGYCHGSPPPGKPTHPPEHAALATVCVRTGLFANPLLNPDLLKLIAGAKGDWENPNSHLASDYGQYRDALQTLQANFDTFDTAASINDGFFTKADLSAILRNPKASPELREAAQFFLDHPEYFNRLEMSVGWDHQDGRVGLGDINKELSQVNADIRRYGLPPAHGISAPPPSRDSGRGPGPVSGNTSSSGEISKILGDPSLSLEEKIMLILSMIMDKVDKEIENVAAKLGDVSDQRSAKFTQNVDQKDEQATRKRDDEVRKLDTAMEKLQLRMQTLMEKRKQMFEMMSNMSTKFHEMSKTAIQNMARA